MLRLVPYLAAGFISASAFAGGYLEPLTNAARAPQSFAARWADANAQLSQPRDRQDRLQDRQTVSRKSEQVQFEPQAVATIGLRGLSTAAIIYRDQNGNVVFRNDPATQTTTIAKGVVVPAAAAPTPASAPRPAPARRDVEREKTETLPDGCESAFSVVAAPSLANIPGRCVS